MKTYDITNLTDAALDVFLSVKAGEDFVDADHLTAAERLAVAEALAGGPLDVRTISRVVGPSGDAKASHFVAADVEGMILAEQEEAEGFNG